MLEDAPKSHFAILTALRAYPDKSITGLTKLTGYGRKTVKKELNALERAGLVASRLVAEPGKRTKAKRSRLTKAGQRAWEGMKDGH